MRWLLGVLVLAAIALIIAINHDVRVELPPTVEPWKPEPLPPPVDLEEVPSNFDAIGFGVYATALEPSWNLVREQRVALDVAPVRLSAFVFYWSEVGETFSASVYDCGTEERARWFAKRGMMKFAVGPTGKAQTAAGWVALFKSAASRRGTVLGRTGKFFVEASGQIPIGKRLFELVHSYLNACPPAPSRSEAGTAASSNR
jgi:hypothetical protein